MGDGGGMLLPEGVSRHPDVLLIIVAMGDGGGMLLPEGVSRHPDVLPL